MNQESEKPSIRLSEFAEPQRLHADSVPRLRKFRLLQLITVAVALVWIIAGVLISNHLIEKELNSELLANQAQLNNEVQFQEHVFEQNLHQSEQLSKTLSLNQSYIELAKTAKNRELNFSEVAREQRVAYLTQLPDVNNINHSFKRLVTQIDAYQIFLQDYLGYCIASGRSGEDDDCIGSRYHTREYFQEAARSGRGRQFAIGRLHTVPSFFFATALEDNEEFLGVIILRVLTSQVTDFVNPNQALSLVAAEDGIVIASSDPSLIFSHVGTQWSPIPDAGKFREIYKQNEIHTIPIEEVKNARPRISLWLWNGRYHLVGKGEVAQGDFHIFLFRDVENIISSVRNHWQLSISIILVGLLVILLIERSVNFSQQRKAHLKALSAANKDLADVSSKLYELTITDSLTGVSTRRYFNQRLEEEVERQHRQRNKGICLLVLDIDEFKKINDSYGHPAGDQAIRCMADICVHSIRSFDAVGRMGGEEFAILLCDLTPEQAREIAGRILEKCQTTEIRFQEHRFKQTCSIGLAHLKHGQSAGQLLSEADKALYQAKNQGRNRYVYA